MTTEPAWPVDRRRAGAYRGSMRGVWIAGTLLSVVACGGKGPPPADPIGSTGDPSGETGGPPAPTDSLVTPQTVCDRIFELRDSDCELTANYSLTRDECIEDFRRSLEDRGPDAEQATVAGARCLIDNGSCDAIGQCLASLTDPDVHSASPTQLRTCADTATYAPVGVSPQEFLRRKGTGIRRFSQAQSTKDQPVEVCGIPAQMEWLLAMTCDDGSRPFRSYDHAHSSRAGNVGPGGRCGSIVDLYEVPCPEGTYQVFIDAYVCPEP